MAGTRYVGVGEETTYGTAVAAAKYIKDADSESFELKIPPSYKDSLSYAAHAYYIKGLKQVTGGFSFPVASENGIGQLLKWILGTDTASGTGPYTHTITEANLVKSFTSRIGRDDTEYVYSGCIIESLKLVAEKGKELLATATVIAKDEATASIGTPSFTTTRYLTWLDGTVGIGGTDKTSEIMAASIEIKNTYETDKAYALGSQTLVAQPALKSRIVTGTIDFREGDDDVRSAFQASTSNSITLTFTGDGTDKLTITIPAAVYDSYKASVKGRDQTTVSVPFTTVYSTSDSEQIRAVLVNSEAGY